MTEPMSDERLAEFRLVAEAAIEPTTESMALWMRSSPVPHDVLDLLDEIERLTVARRERHAQAATQHLRADKAEARADRAAAALARVQALHYRVDGLHSHEVCAHRHCIDDSGDQHRWPCPTAIALSPESPDDGFQLGVDARKDEARVIHKLRQMMK